MQILIVEDDPAIADTLRFALEREGMTVTWMDTVAKVRTWLADSDTPDAVLLDVGLPDGDGFGVCQIIRQDARHRHAPILFLTARSDEIDRVLGLELGADDYIAKPFSPREIVARLKAIWRRDAFFVKTNAQEQSGGAPRLDTASDTAGVLGAGDFVKTIKAHEWQFRARDYRLSLDGTPLPLSKTELLIMLTLIASPMHILSREQILAGVSDHPEHRLARTIDSHIKTLRQKIGNICQDELIVTHRGLGYSLC